MAPSTALALRSWEFRAPTGPRIDGLAPYLPSVAGSWFETGRTLVLTGTYRLRVRAQDPSGTRSAWAYGPTLRVRALQETSPALLYSTHWTHVTGAALLACMRMHPTGRCTGHQASGDTRAPAAGVPVVYLMRAAT